MDLFSLAVFLVFIIGCFAFFLTPSGRIILETLKFKIITSPISTTMQGTPSNLTFSIKECNKNIDPWDKDQMGVKEVKWNNGNTLSVKVYISVLCAGQSISHPNYKIEGNNLMLEYRSTIGGDIAKCMCAKELNYVIKNIPKENYNVVLREK